MDQIGLLFKETREESGVSILEASNDLKIKQVILENIEEGNIGAFKDIFELKEYILSYAKYLGLDLKMVEEKFNSYVFECTSKIPIKEIEKQVIDKKMEETKEIKRVSPYTKEKNTKSTNRLLIVIYIWVFILLGFIIFWSVKQLTFHRDETQIIAYGK